MLESFAGGQPWTNTEGAFRLFGLQGVPALHAPLSGPPRCRSAARGDAPSAGLPGYCDATRSSATAPPQSGQLVGAGATCVSSALCRRPGGAPASRTPPRRAARDARRTPADGSLAKGGRLSAARRAAPPRAPSPDARCGASTDPAPRSASPCLVRGARCAARLGGSRSRS